MEPRRQLAATDLDRHQLTELLTEELCPQGAAPAWRKAIEDAATKAELAAVLDQRLPPIAERRQPAQEIVERVGLRRFQREAPALQRIGRQRWPGHGGPGSEAHDRLPRAERVHGFESTADRLLVGSKSIEGQRLDRGEDHGAHVLAEPSAHLLE